MSVDGTLIYLSIGEVIWLLLDRLGLIEKSREQLRARGVASSGPIIVTSTMMSIVLWPGYPIVFVLGFLFGIIQAVRGLR